MQWKFTGDKPVYQQIMEHLRCAVLTGGYQPGARIEPVRELATINEPGVGDRPCRYVD